MYIEGTSRGEPERQGQRVEQYLFSDPDVYREIIGGKEKGDGMFHRP
jgi:hypothetical protein